MKCLNCANQSFYENKDVSSFGGHGPDLLPGTGFGLFSHARFHLRICSACGFVHWFVNQEDQHRIEQSRRFVLVDYGPRDSEE